MEMMLSRLPNRRVACLAAAVAIVTVPSAAMRIEGTVRDTEDRPVTEALVYVPGADTTTTDSEGRFVLGQRDVGTHGSGPAGGRATRPRLKPTPGGIVCTNPTLSPLDIAVFTPGGTHIGAVVLQAGQGRMIEIPEMSSQVLVVRVGRGRRRRTQRVVLTSRGTLVHSPRAGTTAMQPVDGMGKAVATACTVWVSKSGFVSGAFALACDTGGVKLVLSQTTGGGLCEPCRRGVDCGDGDDLCIATGGPTGYCARACPEGSGCPDGYTCGRVNAGGTIVRQCLPETGVCPELVERKSCTGQETCGEGEVCRYGRCVKEDHLKHCVDLINHYRAKRNRPALSRSTDLEEFAAEGAAYDAARNQAHAHFSAEQNYKLCDAENEVPGWSLRHHGSITAIIDAGTKMMWDEGPGGPHYENMIGNHTKVGCGIYVTEDNKVWLVQDYK